MDDDCKSQLDEIVALLTKIPGKIDELIYEQKQQIKKLDAIESRLETIESYIAGQCE